MTPVEKIPPLVGDLFPEEAPPWDDPKKISGGTSGLPNLKPPYSGGVKKKGGHILRGVNKILGGPTCP